MKDLARSTDLDQSILLNIILEPPQLQMQNRRERLEDDALAGILQAVALGVILVIPVERLYLDIVEERLAQVSQAFDGELNVCAVSACSSL